MRVLASFGLIFVFISFASAQDADAVNPDRPSFSTSTHVVAKGHVQLEGGAMRLRFGPAIGYDIGEVLVRTGVSKRAEIRAGLPSYKVANSPARRVTGADDFLLETKILLKPGDHLALGAVASATLPTGSRDVAEHTFQPGGTFISDIGVSKTVSLTSNASYARSTSNGVRYNDVSGVSTANFSVTSNWSLFTEVFAFNQLHDSTQKYAAAGSALMLGKRTSIDVSGGLGIHNGAHGPDRYFGAGISRLF